MNLSFPSPEFDDAVAAVCHGLATDAQMRALNELLRANPDARDEYLLRVELHARLASEPDLFSGLADEPRPQGREALGGGARAAGWAAIPRPGGEPARRKPVAWAAVAAAAVAVLAVAGWGWWWWRRPARQPRATSAAVAMLTRAVEARWAHGTAAPRVGSPLEPGWLRLETGLAQVAFYSGARLVIEGPTEVQLVSSSEAVCPAGRLLAEVPAPARGFRLKTANLDVVDVGTAFGLQTTRGRTEVHVFDGQVQLSGPTTPAQTLGQGQAVAVETGVAPRFMAAHAAAFASLFEFQQRSLASEALRYEQWQVASAQLNQDPWLVLRLDFASRGSADWTLRNLAGSDRAAPEATIVGCQRAQGRWPEKQALEWQSVNDRVRLVVPGTFEALSLAAWVRLSGLDRQFNSLFMCDGFEPGTIHWLIRRDGVLGLTVFGAKPGQFQILASPPVLGPDQFGLWLQVAVVLDGPGQQVIHYLNGAPVARLALKLPPPFRLGPAELGNWNPRGGPDAAPGLARNLSGALDEFVLFGRALTAEEIRTLYASGKPEWDP